MEFRTGVTLGDDDLLIFESGSGLGVDPWQLRITISGWAEYKAQSHGYPSKRLEYQFKETEMAEIRAILQELPIYWAGDQGGYSDMARQTLYYRLGEKWGMVGGRFS